MTDPAMTLPHNFSSKKNSGNGNIHKQPGKKRLWYLKTKISQLFDDLSRGLATVFEAAEDKDRQEIARLVDERMEKLQGFISEQTAEAVEGLLPLSAIKPRCSWLERQDRKQTPPDFIKDVYTEWLGQGLTQAHIRQVDRSLYYALHKWLKSNDMPNDLDLPTRKQMNDRLLQQHGIPSAAESWGKIYNRVGPVTKEKIRLYTIARTRSRRNAPMP